MLTIINHLTAFWSVVVMNCIRPVNWKYCYRIDQWLIPELHQGILIYIDKNHNHLYIEERKYLDKLNAERINGERSN
jgi:hypothetical protein